MEVRLSSGPCIAETFPVSQALHAPFELIGQKLSGDYGGIMEHLWINIDLVLYGPWSGKAWPFRFQRRVSGKCRLAPELQVPVQYNVGQYGICPDFDRLLATPIDQVALYALPLIYTSSSVLHKHAKMLGGFDASLFQSRFASVCASYGYMIKKQMIPQRHSV